MKKIVVILIVGLYIGSIFLVNFFGLQYVPHVMTEYVSQIECNIIEDLAGNEIDYDQATENEDGQIEKWFITNFIKDEYDETNLADNPNTFKIVCSVLPDNAKNKSVILSYHPDNTRYIIDEQQMTVTFLKNASSVAITITSADGSSIKERIVIVAI